MGSRIARCSLAAEYPSVAAAREFVDRTVRDWQLDLVLGPSVHRDLLLVASELVTNALRHGLRLAAAGAAPGEGPLPARPDQPLVGVALLAAEANLTCAVTDPGGGIPAARPADPFAESGRGLLLVEALSLRWGWHGRVLHDGRPAGKTVWAQFPLQPALPLAAASA